VHDGNRGDDEVAEPAASVRRPGAWPWFAGVLVLALLLWGLTRLLDGGAPVAAEPVSPPAAPAAGH
jgi:hypothetical protein